MKIYFFTLLIFFHFCTFSQKNISVSKGTISGTYRIELREFFTDKGVLYYSTTFEGLISIEENGTNITAKKLKNSEPYFIIVRIGNAYKISFISQFTNESNIYNLEFFKDSIITLKLLTSKEFYTIYTLKRITKKEEIYTKISQGTGFFINNKGCILTNYHVISKGNLITILTNNNEYDCDIVYANENDDIAILKVRDSLLKTPFLSFSINESEVGEVVFTLGYPLASTMGKELKFSDGIINSLKGFKDDPRYMQFSAPIDPGSSGGPILNKSGNLIGLVTAKYTVATNAGYGLKLSYILSNIPKSISIYKESNPKSISNALIYAENKNSIILIKSYSL